MPTQKLTDLGLQNLVPPATGHTDFWDTTLPTFGVRVSPKGTKTFVLKLQNSRRAIGRYPRISLSQARDEAKKLLAEKTLGRMRPQAVSFPAARALFLEDKGRRARPKTLAEYKRLLDHFPFKGHLDELRAEEVARIINKIPYPSERDHTLVAAKVFFNWAIKRRYLTYNPTLGISAHEKVSRSRVLSDEELGRIWRACEQTGEQSRLSKETPLREPPGEALPPPRLPANFCTIVKLLILTGQRRGEVTALRTNYILCSTTSSVSSSDGSLLPVQSSSGSEKIECTITLPASLTKNKREHTFPVGKVAVSLLDAALPLSPPRDQLVFPARGKETPFNGFGKAKAQLDKLSGTTDWTLHDLRRTFATRLAELGVAPHVIERLLNHISGTISGVAATYNRARYLPEMRQAVAAWETDLQKNVIYA